jgi:hypothetical protein
MTPIATDPCVLLEANRARLRLHFRATAAPSGSTMHGPQAAPHWVAALAALAQGGTAADCVLAWWKSLPLSRALDVVAHAAQDALKPVAQRHPVRLVAGALVAGAVLVWLRPWRWVTAGCRSIGTRHTAGEWLVRVHRRAVSKEGPATALSGTHAGCRARVTSAR